MRFAGRPDFRSTAFMASTPGRSLRIQPRIGRLAVPPAPPVRQPAPPAHRRSGPSLAAPASRTSRPPARSRKNHAPLAHSPLAGQTCGPARSIKGEKRGSRSDRQGSPAHRRRSRHGARRDHADRRGIRGRDRPGRRPFQADRPHDRDPRRAQGQGARQGTVEFLADRLGQGLWPDHGRIRLSGRRDGLVAAGLRSVQLLGARHRQHGGAGAVRLA